MLTGMKLIFLTGITFLDVQKFVCLQKLITTRPSEHESPCWYDDRVSFISDLESPKRIAPHAVEMAYNHHPYPFKPTGHEFHHLRQHDQFLLLPQLGSPKIPKYDISPVTAEEPVHQIQLTSVFENNGNIDQSIENVTDWRVLDKFVASQLSQDEVSKEPKFSSSDIEFQVPEKQEVVEFASSSTSSGPLDLWK